MDELTHDELLATLHIDHVSSSQLYAMSVKTGASYDVVIFLPTFNPEDKYKPYKHHAEDNVYLERINVLLSKIVPLVNEHGALFVYNLPRWLPYAAVYLDSKMTFKYWFAVKHSVGMSHRSATLSFAHEGILFYVKSKNKFIINRVRVPHVMCRSCHDYLADWGGKKDLRNPIGYVVSDVWDDLPKDKPLKQAMLERMLHLACAPNNRVIIIDDAEQGLSSG